MAKPLILYIVPHTVLYFVPTAPHPRLAITPREPLSHLRTETIDVTPNNIR